MLIFLSTLTAYAQEISVVGHFKIDSVKLGEPLEYFVTINYPSQWQVLLPDSTFSFSPFEYQQR
jgi:hypothetical protein